MKLSVIASRSIWYTLSGIMVIGSIAVFLLWGLKQGIEFTGGSMTMLRFEQARPAVDALDQVVKTAGVDVGADVIQQVGDTDMQMRSRTLSQDEYNKILAKVKEKYSNVKELSFYSIGPTIGEELRQKAVQGLVLALFFILIYVAYVFRKVSMPVQSWKYGVVTIFTAFHDVIVPVGVFSILGHFADWEIGTPFIAALLTILGYSITDTIVVFDRVRENLQKMSGSFEQIVEASVHQTFLRSFNTSMATLLTLAAIFLFGGSSLHEFTLSLMIGIAVGTYSSIFIASPVLVSWYKWAAKKRN